MSIQITPVAGSVNITLTQAQPLIPKYTQKKGTAWSEVQIGSQYYQLGGVWASWERARKAGLKTGNLAVLSLLRVNGKQQWSFGTSTLSAQLFDDDCTASAAPY